MWMNNMAMHHPTATPDDGDDDSWEVKAFQEDTSNILGATWPPRSYTCSFCMREFRSAQALGGHMNVHRRDRARLHHQPPQSLGGSNNKPLPSSSPSLIIPTHQDLISNSGVCYLYSLPSPHGLAPTSLVNNYPSCMNNSQNYSPFSSNNLLPDCPPSAMNDSASFSNDNHLQENNDVQKDSADGEIDLELRLGYKSSASSSSSSYTP